LDIHLFVCWTIFESEFDGFLVIAILDRVFLEYFIRGTLEIELERLKGSLKIILVAHGEFLQLRRRRETFMKITNVHKMSTSFASLDQREILKNSKWL
jgi:hypothetical protein